MARKNPFPPEPDTQPEHEARGKAPRHTGPAPKARSESPRSERSKGDRSQEPTLPPPRKRSKPDARTSGVQSRRPPRGHDDRGGARVDEVVADLSRDPRREK